MRSIRPNLSAGGSSGRWTMIVIGLLFWSVKGHAQFTYSEDFKNSTAAGWVLSPTGNSNPNVTLTSGAATRSGDPEAGGIIDPSGSGWLRLTNNTLNTHNAVYFDTPIPSAGNSVTIEFGVNLWGGNNFNNTGADGLTFFLYDASKPFQVGADGGSLGYAQKTGVDGLNGGFVAVALDAYGNFSVAGEGRQGGTAGLQANSVAVRGPGQGVTGYDYLAGTGNRDLTDTGSPNVQDAGDGTVPALPYTMGYATATARPNQSTQYRNVSITIDENSQLAVSMKFGEDGLWYNLLNVDLSSFVRPEQLKMGFSAGTGSGTMITEVGGILSINATAGTGNFIWDNGEGASNKVWGTSATNPLNWAGNTNPTLKSNVIFNSSYVSTGQVVDVAGSDKVIQNVYFSGEYGYTLTTTEARRLIFDSNTVGGLTTINIMPASGGDAAHTVALDVQMNRNLDLINTITPLFTISGNIDLGSNQLAVKGSGTTLLSGAISGTGSLVKSDTGTTILSGAAANTYTGTSTITGGTLQIEKATALGSTSSGTTVTNGGTLALAGTGTTFAAEALSISGDGVGGNGALRNIAGMNTWTGAVALASAGSNTIGVDAGTNLTVSGVISGAAGNNLTKVGAGTLALTGINTFSGATTIQNGIVAIGSDANLGTAPLGATAGHLTLNGGTLQNTASLTLSSNRGVALGSAGGTFETNSGTTLTYNGIIAGAAGGSLNKTGSGILSLGGVSTYNGATNISAGTLQLGTANALPTATAVTVANGATFALANYSAGVGSVAGAGNVSLGSGTLTVGGTTSTTFSGTASGTGGITKTGSSTLTLSGANTFTGALTVGTGSVNASNILQLGASNAIADGATLALNGGVFRVAGSFSDSIGGLNLLSSSTIDFAGNTSTLTFANVSRTAGTLTIDNWAGDPFGAGASQLKFTSAADFTVFGGGNINFTGWGTGSIRLATGEIVPNTGGTIYTYAVTGSGNWNSDSNWSDNGQPAASDPGTFASAIGDTAILGAAATGPATISLNGANRTLGYLVINSDQNYTVSGDNLAFNVNSGLAQLTNSGAGTQTISSGVLLNDALNILNNGSGSLTLSGGISNASGVNNITVTGAGTTILSGAITTDAGSLTKTGSGTLTLGGTNTYSGGTTITDGTVRISATENLGASTGSVLVSGGTLESTASLTLASTRAVTVGAAGGTFDTNSGTTLTYNGTLAGTGTLTKADAGVLSLGGNTANTHSGNLHITAGAVEIAKNNTGGNGGIGDSAAVTLSTGATLQFNGGTNQTVETIGSLSGSGTVTNLQATALTLTTGGNNASTTFSGVLQDSGGNLSLVKAGGGSFTLSGANTYDGTTTASSGVLNVQSNTALGSTTNGTVVLTNAALELEHATGITVTGEGLTLSGTGVNSNGALRNISGANTWTGAVTLGAPAEIQTDGGTLTLSGNIGGTQNLAIDGAGNTALSGVIGIATGTLTKNGSGTLTLSNANTYSGATVINGGTVAISHASALGTTPLGTTIASGATLALSGGISSAEAIGVNGQGVGNLGAIRSTAGNNTLTGGLTLNGATYVGVDAASTLTTTGIISGTNDVTKVGAGTLVLNGAVNNTYTGTTAIDAGVLEFRQAGQLGGGSGVTTLADGATLRLNASGTTVAENVTLRGYGVSQLGGLQNTGGNNTWTGNLTMSANSGIGATSGTTLTTSGTIAGAFSLTKVDSGNLHISGANTYTGTTTVRNGTITVSADALVAANGSLGNSTTAVQLGDVSTGSTDNLGFLVGNAAGGVTVDRALAVNNFNASGTTNLGGINTSGTNTIGGSTTLSRDVLLTASTGGTVAFTGAVSGTGAINKVGDGTVTLSGANTFSGATTVSAGTLVAASATALGSTAAGVTVTSGGTLGLQGGITLPSAESLTISGTGAGNVGALSNISGNNTIASAIALAGASSIGAQAGTLTVDGVISGSGSLATTGAGNILLTATNTYSGVTEIGGSGRVTLASAGSALSATSGVTVQSGATLSFGGSNQIVDTADLTLAGGTLLVNGFQEVMRNVGLTASTTSYIDYLNDGSLLRFTGSASAGGGATLTIDNWAGNPSSNSGNYGLLFNTQAQALALENAVLFNGWTTLGNNAVVANGSYWEIVPVVTVTEWGSTTGGNWDEDARWTGGAQPDNTGAIAMFGNAITAGTSVTIDLRAGKNDDETIGKLIFDTTGDRNYTISGTNALEFDASGSTQLIVAGTGQHTIASAVTVLDDLTITNDGTGAAPLTLSGTMNLRNGTSSDLFVTGTGSTSISGVISNQTAGAALLKTGSGTLTLGGANTFSGGTTLRNGTLILNDAAATGSAATIVVNDASTTGSMNTSLLIGMDGINVAKAITVNAQGATTTLGGATTLTAATDEVTFSNSLSLGKTVDLTASGASLATFSGAISGTGGINKVGSGTVTLSGSGVNTFSGPVTVNTGTLEITKSVANAGLGDASAVTIASGATVKINNGLAETIGSLAGAGTLNNAHASGTTVTTGGNNASTTFSGSITNTVGSLALTKQGTGTMILSGDSGGVNGYSGITTVAGGTLVAASNTALGTGAAGTVVNTGATLGLQGGITVTGEALSLAAATSPSTASLANLSGTNLWTGAVSMTGTTANDQVKLEVAGGSQLTLSGTISEGTNAKVLAKTGTGTLVLSGANNYAGSTNIAAGTLVAANSNALGTIANGTTVQIGATLGVQNNVTIASGESFLLYGTVNPPSAPSIKNIQDNNTLDGAILLSGGINTGVAIDSNLGSLTLNGAITQASNPNYVVKTGSGSLILDGTVANTFSGGFTINDGLVIASKTINVDATGAGAVNIGNGIGDIETAVLQLNENHQIKDSSNVTIATDGKLDLQNKSDAIGALTMGGGSVTGTGTLTLNSNLTFNGVGNSTATISSNLDIGASGSRIIQIGNNGLNGDTDLAISGMISGAAAFNKTDLGTLEISGSAANTFSGGMQVSDGTLLLNKTAGTGASGTGTVTIGDGSGAANTATLKLLQNEQMADTRVTISSDGKFDVNGLTETIGSFAGAGTIATGTGGTGLLIAGGDDTSTAFGGFLTGDGTIRKTGEGTLTFNQSISFAAGTLELNNGTLALGTSGAGVTFTVGTLFITGDTILDFGNSAASVLNATNLVIAPGATLLITNWINNVDYFFAQNWSGSVFDTRGQGDELKVTFNGYNNTSTAWLEYGSNREITPAPEPATYGAIMMGAALGFLGYRRFRKPAANAQP